MMSATESIPSGVQSQRPTEIPKAPRFWRKDIAWKTTQTLLICVGGTGGVAFMASLAPWLALMGFGCITLTWFVLYRLLLDLAWRRVNR